MEKRSIEQLASDFISNDTRLDDISSKSSGSLPLSVMHGYIAGATAMQEFASQELTEYKEKLKEKIDNLPVYYVSENKWEGTQFRPIKKEYILKSELIDSL